MKSISRQTVNSIVGLLFIISGALGLIYQIIWFKYLSLFLGNTTYAQTIVLATFMGGLAIGSALWGRKVDKTKQPLRLYALLELGIGVYCLLYPKFLGLLKDIFITIVILLQLPSDGSVVLLLKLLVSFCTLLLPTILMGGTLPVLVKFISNRLEESGKNIAILYFLNSFGAVIGSLLAGFFFIRILGLSVSIYSAAIVNLLVGSFAFLLTMWTLQPENPEVEETREPETIFSRREIILAIAVAGISGLAAMIYEVTWVRLLIPVLGSATYSFSLMLVAFISGITIGSYIVSFLVQRVRHLPSLLIWCQFGIVLSLLVTLPLYARIPYEFWRAATILTRSETTYPFFLTIQFFFSFILMIVPTIFLGMSLPVATRIAARGIDVLGKSVGNVFAVNTLGTVVGSLSAGLILIPLIGIKHAIEIGIGFNLLAGMLILLFAGTVSRRNVLVAVPILLISLIGYVLVSPNWSQSVMLTGVFRQINCDVKPPSSYSSYVKGLENTKVIYYKEGTMATVGVTESGSSDNSARTLVINGKADASSTVDMPTQVLLGQLPCLLHPNAQTALVIGLGSGVTAGSILTHSIKHLDCVEISPEVVEASSKFNDVNNKPLTDPRMTLHIEDALAFLNLTPRMYDIIVSEPSNPWIAGIGSLYTTEFFEMCKRRMNTGGMMIQWFHLYEMNDDIFKMVVRTFRSSFKYVSIWQPVGGDVILLGLEQPLSVDFSRLQAVIASKGIKEDLQRIHIQDAATLLSLEMLSPESVSRYISIGELNNEDHLQLEYRAPSAFYINRGVGQIAQLDERRNSNSCSLQINKLMETRRLTDEELRNIGFFHTVGPNSNLIFGYSILCEYLKTHSKDIAVLKKVADIAERLKRNVDALNFYKILMELEPRNPEVLGKYAWLKYISDRATVTTLTSFDTKEYENLLHKSIKLVADTLDLYRVRLADIYFGTQQYAKAKDQFARAIQIRESHAGNSKISYDVLLLRLAHCLYLLNENNRAASYAMAAIQVNPQNEEAKDLVYEIFMGGTAQQQSKSDSSSLNRQGKPVR